MALHNPLTGETIVFRGNTGDTLQFDLELRPLGAPGGVVHRHGVSEHIDVRSGELLALVQGRLPRRMRAGDALLVPGNTWHMLVALRRSSARVTVRPAMRFAEVLRCFAAVGSGDVRPQTLRRLNALLREHGCVPRLPT